MDATHLRDAMQRIGHNHNLKRNEVYNLTYMTNDHGTLHFYTDRRARLPTMIVPHSCRRCPPVILDLRSSRNPFIGFRKETKASHK